MTFAKPPLCSLLLVSVVLTACGGGSSSSSDPEVPETTPSSESSQTDSNREDTAETEPENTAPDTPDDLLEVAQYEPGEITAEDAGKVARTIISALSRRIQFRSALDPERIQEASPLFPIGTQPTTNACTIAGESSITISADSQWTDSHDHLSRIYTTGDSVAFSYEECQGYLSENNLEIYDGNAETNYLSGFVDGAESLYSEEASIQKTYDRMSYLFEPLIDPNYQHGNIKTDYLKGKHDLTGSFYAQRVVILHHEEDNDNTTDDTLVEQITTNMLDFHWTVEEGISASLTGYGTLGSNLLESSFEMGILEPLLAGKSSNTGWEYEIIDSGTITAEGTTGLLEITFLPEYISYRFDGDGDGDFETNGNRFWYQVLPSKL